MNWSAVRNQAALWAKRKIYSRKGEPYPFAGKTLRYVPGTKPIRLKYLHSKNGVNRYDALQVVWIDSNLRDGDVAIDVGAHHGVYAVLMALKCGAAGQVVAFEPDPYAQQVLQRNLALNADLKKPIVETMACSDVDGEAILFSRCGNSNSSLARSGIGGAAAQLERICVPTVTLDSYLALHRLHPDFVKIDTEGAEIRVLRGAQKLLDSEAMILCELHPYVWAEFGTNFAELKDLLAGCGRRMRFLDQQHELLEPRYGMTVLERC
jgi:FkbM family methyltransferase